MSWDSYYEKELNLLYADTYKQEEASIHKRTIKTHGDYSYTIKYKLIMIQS